MSHPHAHRHSPSFRQEVKDAVTPRASLLVIGVVALQLLFIASYVGALHRPKPTDVPFGVAATGAVAGQTADRLRRLPGAPLDPRAVAGEAAARRQILRRDIDGALVVDPAGTTDTLLVASGGGTALATTLERIVGEAEKAQRRTVRTVDVAPASTGDFDGLSSFYLVVGWSVGGYLCASILAISTGARPANPRRAAIRLASMALVAVAGGAGGALIVGPALNALPGGVLQLWGLGALVTFAVGAATLALQGVFGIVGIGLAILLVVIAGNPSAGGAFPLPMLPPFWKAIGPALPPGAGTWAARSIAYFRGNALTNALLVLGAWAAAGVVITLLASALRKKRAGTAPGAVRPAGAPVGAGSPAVPTGDAESPAADAAAAGHPAGAGAGAHRYGGEGTGEGPGGGGSDAGPVPEEGEAGARPGDGTGVGPGGGGFGGGPAPAAASGTSPQAAGDASGTPPQVTAQPDTGTAWPGATSTPPEAAVRTGAGGAPPGTASAPPEASGTPPQAADARPGTKGVPPEAAVWPGAGGTPAESGRAESGRADTLAGEEAPAPESETARAVAGEEPSPGSEAARATGSGGARAGTGEGDTFVDPDPDPDPGPAPEPGFSPESGPGPGLEPGPGPDTTTAPRPRPGSGPKPDSGSGPEQDPAPRPGTDA